MEMVFRQQWRTWLLALGGAGFAVVLALSLFRVPKTARPPVPSAPPATVGFMGLKEAGNGMDLLDPTPLFLPTKWNARPNAGPADALRELSGAFHDYPAVTNFSEDAANTIFPPNVSVPAKLVDALAIGPPEAPFLGMGRLDRPVPVLAVRDAFVEIVSAGDGREVFRQAIAGVQPPGGVDWKWMEFLVVVEPAGLVGAPVLTASSGFEQVDGFFQNYLGQVLRVGERLPPGFYRVKVGP